MNDIDCEVCHPILSVTNVGAAVDFYTTKLGFWLAFSEGNFAGVNLGEVQIFLTEGKPAPQGCSLYFVVGDADKLHEKHRSNGVEVVEALGDRSYKLRDYTVRDASGYSLTFGHRL
jgi:uncharacterized glyoxalase superfamily protein PhnB